MVFYKGSLFDNTRVGNLIYDFPDSIEKLKITIPETENVWSTKILVDFQPVQVVADTIENPEVTLVFPKIESQRSSADVQTVSAYSCLFNLFLNAGEIINRPRLYYGKLAIPSFDSPERAARRLKLVKIFFENCKIREAKTVFAGVRNCWPL